MMRKIDFKPKLFFITLSVCTALAGVVSWFSGLDFWILAALFFGAMLLNGWIATLEDKDEQSGTDPE